MNKVTTTQTIERVKRMREDVEVLLKETDEFPALQKNALRIKASIRMLELNLGLRTVK